MYNLACVAAGRIRRTQTFDWLRLAVGADYDSLDEISHDTLLQSLHGELEFERLLAAARKRRACESGPLDGPSRAPIA